MVYNMHYATLRAFLLRTSALTRPTLANRFVGRGRAA